MQCAGRNFTRALAAGISAAALAFIVGTTTPQPAQADEADAERLLKAMSDYLGARTAISFDYDTELEVITADLQKVALASSGSIVVNQPDKVWATRTGGFADVELIFDGKALTLFGKTTNLYAQIDVPGDIDHLIDELRDTYGKPVPGADLLSSNVYDALMSETDELKDFGSGVIGGVECDHIAGRTGEVDWQIWIAQGERPYPCRYIVTSKLVAGSPQYSIYIRNWNADGDVASVDFSFSNTTNAENRDVGDLPDIDELSGIFAVGGE